MDDTDDVDRFREYRRRLERSGLGPTPASRYRRDPDTGEAIGLYLALEFREGSEDYLVRLPHLIEALLPDQAVIGTPHLCPEASWVLGKQIVVVRTKERRRAA